MPVPHVSTSSQSALDLTADVLLIAVAATDDGARVLRTDVVTGELADALDASLRDIGFRGSPDEVRRIPAPFGACASVALVGVGSGDIGPDELRYAAGSAARQLRAVSTIAIAFPAAADLDITAILEGAAIGAYRFTEYRSTPSTSLPAEAIAEPGVDSIDSIVLAVTTTPGADVTRVVTATVTAMATVRDLVNTPASDLYPASFADRARESIGGLDIELTVLDEADLVEQGYGGIVGVGQGSARPPRLVTAVWSPEGAVKHLALVGKGITFDTGGLSLKPPTGMVGMKYDMTGAATALGVVVAAAALALPVKITAWMCMAENMPSGTATRPGDVITMKNGRTVEVLNTDAEGRLVLGDGLVAASADFPDGIIDIATLTGAVSIALGNRYVGAMGETAFVQQVMDAAARVGETMWRLPLPAELRSMLDSDIADLTNVKIGNTAGGTLIAGLFLQEFVGRTADGSSKIPWVHLDIAGAANNSLGGYGYTGKGPTGVTVRALLEVAADFSRA